MVLLQQSSPMHCQTKHISVWYNGTIIINLASVDAQLVPSVSSQPRRTCPTQTLASASASTLLLQQSWTACETRHAGETVQHVCIVCWWLEAQIFHAGANVSMAIMFLRSALLLTCLLFILWFCCVAVPFIIWPPSTFSWSIFRSSSASALVQGYGLDDTFLLYGGCLWKLAG